MKKIILFVFIIILLVFISECATLKQNGNQTTNTTQPIKQPENQTPSSETNEDLEYLNFRFLNDSCYLGGDIFLNENFIGKTVNGVKVVYWKDVAYYINKSGENLICMKGYLPSCFNEYIGWNFEECWNIDLSQDNFDDTDIRFLADIHTRVPQYPFEMLNFVKPEQVKSYTDRWRETLAFNNDTEHDLNVIWKYMNTLLQYREDSTVMGVADYWKQPNETIGFWGDCEDWTNAFVSLALAYNNSLRCYSLALEAHLTSFCKFKKDDVSYQYAFYDQRTNEMQIIRDNDPEKEKELRILIDRYFESYGYYKKDILIAFNDKEYFEFEKNENKDFINWALYAI